MIEINQLGRHFQYIPYMWRRICIGLITLPIVSCSAPEGSVQERFVPARPVTTIVSDTVVGTAQGAWGVVQMPFEDLNLKQQPIPDKLQQIVDHPYELPPQMLCDGIRKEIAELDTLLGPDVCTIDNPTGITITSRKGEYVEQGAGIAREQTLGLIRGKVDFIPFRGMVRKVTGAEKHAKKVERAYQAGRLRRAFLKGLGASLGPKCLQSMATPQPMEENLH